METFKTKAAWFKHVASLTAKHDQPAGGASALALMEMAWQLKTLNENVEELTKAVKAIGR